MECEVCGGEIRERGFRIVVEGSEVIVCLRCKDFGVAKQTSQIKKVPVKKRPAIKTTEITEELLENYNLIIRREREKRMWSQEILAKKIQEKESLIKKIENAEITPEPKVIEKLEKLFNVKLREKVPDVKVDLRRKNVTPTLGDIVIIKKRKS
jgi:putative transcription factor